MWRGHTPKPACWLRMKSDPTVTTKLTIAYADFATKLGEIVMPNPLKPIVPWSLSTCSKKSFAAAKSSGQFTATHPLTTLNQKKKQKKVNDVERGITCQNIRQKDKVKRITKNARQSTLKFLSLAPYGELFSPHP